MESMIIKLFFVVWALFTVLLIVGINVATPRVPGTGTHNVIVTAVERSGIVWKTWTVYVKTDAMSSQEESYCVIDAALVQRLKLASEMRERINLKYDTPFLTWNWECGREADVAVGAE